MIQLTGQFLIATPSMPDIRFAHSVVLLCAHSDQGAMGIIINKPMPDLRLPTLLSHLDITRASAAAGLGGDSPDLPVHFGGPVETSRGFVLHSPDFFGTEGSMTLGDGLVLSTSVEVLSEMARGQGPGKALVALGYSGWGPQQLEQEIQAGGWLMAEATAQLVFATEDAHKWGASLAQIGVDPRMLSGATGHA